MAKIPLHHVCLDILDSIDKLGGNAKTTEIESHTGKPYHSVYQVLESARTRKLVTRTAAPEGRGCPFVYELTELGLQVLEHERGRRGTAIGVSCKDVGLNQWPGKPLELEL